MLVSCVMLYDVVLLVWLVGCARVVLVLVLLYLTLVNYTVFVIVILLKTNFLRLLARLRLLACSLAKLETKSKIRSTYTIKHNTGELIVSS